MVRRQLFQIFVLCLVLFGLAFALAPWFAFRALKANARDHDVAGLAEMVDLRAPASVIRSRSPDNPPPPLAKPDRATSGAIRSAPCAGPWSPSPSRCPR